jgi:repressor LexA
MKGLTHRQQEVLDFIEEYVATHGFPPSVRNIAAHLSLVSASGVHKHIKALVRKKALSKQEFTSRSLRVLKRGTVSGPVSGDFSVWKVAGTLSPQGIRKSTEDHPGVLRMPSAWVGKHPPGQVLFIEGEAFGAQGIHANDALLISKGALAAPSDMLLVQSNGNYVLAASEEASRLPGAEVYGVVVGLWRTYRGARTAASAS